MVLWEKRYYTESLLVIPTSPPRLYPLDGLLFGSIRDYLIPITPKLDINRGSSQLVCVYLLRCYDAWLLTSWLDSSF